MPVGANAVLCYGCTGYSWSVYSTIVPLHGKVCYSTYTPTYLTNCQCRSLTWKPTCSLCIAVGVLIQLLLQVCWRWVFATCLSIRAGPGIWRMPRTHMKSFKEKWKNLWWFLQTMPVSYFRTTSTVQLCAFKKCACTGFFKCYKLNIHALFAM